MIDELVAPPRVAAPHRPSRSRPDVAMLEKISAGSARTVPAIPIDQSLLLKPTYLTESLTEDKSKFKVNAQSLS